MRIALALILVAGLTATANADAWTWFSLESEATAAAADMGAVLKVDDTPGTVTIHQWVQVDEPMELSAINCDLNYGTSTAITIDSYDVDAGAGLLGYWLSKDLPAIDAAGVSGYGAYYFVGAPTEAFITASLGASHVATFNLTIGEGAINQELVGGVGFNSWAAVGGAEFPIHFGETVITAFDTASETPMVKVIPEPATIALIGFGALALIRRR